MKLIRYNHPELTAFDDIDRWFEEAFSNFGRWPGMFDGAERNRLTAQPAADLYEDNDNYYVRFELPGVTRGDINLEFDRNFLTMKAERKEKSDKGKSAFTLSRSITVPEGVNSGKIAAKFENGLLTVTLPKAEGQKPKRIGVK